MKTRKRSFVDEGDLECEDKSPIDPSISQKFNADAALCHRHAKDILSSEEQAEETASDNCPICVTIQRTVKGQGLSIDSMCAQRFFLKYKTIPWAGETFYQYLTALYPQDFKCTLGLLKIKEDTLRSLELAVTYDYPPNTGDLAVAGLAKSWLDECIHSHDHGFHNSCYRPPRLLEIGDDKTRLIITKDQDFSDSHCRYATLSHCWGTKRNFVKLTSKTLLKLCKGIPTKRLARNFREAILFCKRLDIQYIWIDSLCILQSGKGSEEYWLQHLTEMRHIYQNCVLNVAASRAKDVHGGLYTPRNPDAIKPVIFNYRHFGFKRSYALYNRDFAKLGHYDCPLSQRGWVFQERLLSPRVVHFGYEQIFWECPDSILKCETYPAGIEPYIDWPLDLEFANMQNLQISELPQKNEPKRSIVESLNRLIKEYTRRTLTYPDVDKLAAFAGVAEQFAHLLDDRYIAGMFQCQLPEALLWKILDPPPTCDSRTSVYRCPSWSWAKMDSTVEPFDMPVRANGRKEKPLATVLDVQMLLTDPNNLFGRLKSARLKIRGRSVPFQWDMYPGIVDESERWQLWYQATQCVSKIEGVSELYTDDISFDGIEESRSAQNNVIFLPIFSSLEYVQGLILRKAACRETEAYERIGRANIRAFPGHCIPGSADLIKRVKELDEREFTLI